MFRFKEINPECPDGCGYEKLDDPGYVYCFGKGDRTADVLCPNQTVSPLNTSSITSEYQSTRAEGSTENIVYTTSPQTASENVEPTLSSQFSTDDTGPIKPTTKPVTTPQPHTDKVSHLSTTQPDNVKTESLPQTNVKSTYTPYTDNVQPTST